AAQALCDQLAFEAVECLVQRELERRVCRLGFSRVAGFGRRRYGLAAEMAQLELDDAVPPVPLAQGAHDGSRDRVLELTHVAGPRMALQPACEIVAEPQAA